MVRVQNEIQNDGKKRNSSRKALAIATALICTHIIRLLKMVSGSSKVKERDL